jgi:hypothetical protein
MMDTTVYVEETEVSWIIYVKRNDVGAYTIVEKQDDEIANVDFVERYLLRENVFRVKKLHFGYPVTLRLENELGK